MVEDYQETQYALLNCITFDPLTPFISKIMLPSAVSTNNNSPDGDYLLSLAGQRIGMP